MKEYIAQNELNMQDFEPCFDDQGGACYEYLRV